MNTNKLTINTNTIIDSDITFFMDSTKGYPYYSRFYPIFNREPIYFEENQHRCITFPIPFFKEMETSSGKTIKKSFYFSEPINKYQNLSFTDIKDLSLEKEHFIDIFLINKNQHKITINTGLLGFIYQNITFRKHNEEMYQTNSIDLLAALYHLTYENENHINEIINIQIYKKIWIINHKQTPREPEMPFKILVDKIEQTDLTRKITKIIKDYMKSTKLRQILTTISNK